MPTLKGKWYFKDVLDLASIETEHSHYAEQDFFCVDGTNYRYLHFSNNSAHSVIYGLDEVFPYYMGEYWYSNSYRKIEFLYPIEIDEDFYNWFTKNAVPLTIEGTWRFNKNLVIPTTADINGHISLGCGFVSGWTNGHYSEYAQNLDYISFSERSKGNYYLQAFIKNSDSDECVNLWESNTGWVSDAARLLTFSPNTESYDGEEFALWFYENAHSTELKLYSECYIAETADKIRECVNDNTLTFKVSDLADGVQTAYDAGYSQGVAEGGGGYDTPTVTLTINRTGADDTALLLTKIYYTTYEDGAFKQKTFSNLYSSGGSVTLSSIVREAHIVIDGGSGNMTSISSPMSPMFIPYIASSLLFGRVAILSINNDCPANVTLTING